MNKDYIIDELKKQIANVDTSSELKSVGKVLEVGDGVAKVAGLDDLMMSEMVKFDTEDGENLFGVALNLEDGRIGVIIIGEVSRVREGMKVSATGKILSIPVSDEMIGRVVDPIGTIIDDGDQIKKGEYYPIEKIAPGVMTRAGVSQPLQTGIKSIDSMIPIGRGQRELIIGDRQTGKTAIAIDTIINQKGEDVICIYVAIGQKKSKIAQIVEKLKENDAMEHTIIVVAGSSDPAAFSFISPYSGCAIGEYFMEQGKDVLIVFDDLSKHAWAYRQLSLLLKRPPGREAYPGDVFYLHSRLLERSAKLNKENGGASMTALPIIETQAGDISAFIPTNVISITDGQIFLESDLFYQGIRPAINVGLSVSRVGSAAQTKAMKKVAGKIKLELAQFRELEAFTKFGSELDDRTKQKIDRGYRTIEILKQAQYASMLMEDQVAIMWALTKGYIDEVEVEKVKEWEAKFSEYMQKTGKDALRAIKEEKNISEELEEKLVSLTEDFNSTWKEENEEEQEKEEKEEKKEVQMKKAE
ncbi:F0F1 ATP synthase subunit alpha [bacterium]|jgi:F-type H+/Na+-transporting ATPase subunit alpha|nr:F0F1 ATP synthase subunit alpha [bacterium]MBT4251112.1 F0F1 ATP synthase subunit alpha [bacterium]MBT4598096.1 F0F1 ATP synthase subunit alpha [bacterium]MBT6753438.1 F0F1 ATP synthase subunit alpha [bacterium]MBT7038151.1 F0F1 ATP synthase subunit alpha [bacterium]